MSESPPSQTPPLGVELAGQMAGEYRLVKKLGEGGFGAVYEAEHPLLKRRAAVKVLHKVDRMDSDAVLRFISEAQAANQVHSRHIVDIFSFGKLPDGRHFYVMDLLHGEPLDRYLARETRLGVPQALQLLRPIVEALDAAHAAGVIHRDLKPQNVFLVWEKNGETVPKLLDFGTAKLLDDSLVQTASGTPVGTPLYMSPEQARGEKVDRRADVYALGVVCHQLLTGQLPISGSSTLVVLMAHVAQAPRRVSEVVPELSPELDAPILRMLEKNPEARPPTAGEALAALIAAAERVGLAVPEGMPHLPPPAEPTTSERPARTGPTAPSTAPSPTVTGRRVSRPLLVLAAVALAGGAVFLATRPRRPPPAPPAAVAVPPPSPAPPPPIAVTPAVPPPVEVTIAGAPDGARISLQGQPLGATPGPVTIPHGETAVELTITAPGHEPARITLVPDRSRTETVSLKKRAAPRPRRSISKDLESPF